MQEAREGDEEMSSPWWVYAQYTICGRLVETAVTLVLQLNATKEEHVVRIRTPHVLLHANVARVRSSRVVASSILLPDPCALPHVAAHV